MASMPELGSKISLISKSDIRYEGQLYTVDPNECTIALANGKSNSSLIFLLSNIENYNKTTFFVSASWNVFFRLKKSYNNSIPFVMFD